LKCKARDIDPNGDFHAAFQPEEKKESYRYENMAEKYHVKPEIY
jgi:hypothetical protein